MAPVSIVAVKTSLKQTLPTQKNKKYTTMVTNQRIQVKETRRKLTSASKSYFLIGLPRQEV
jgi:hypothetical protein